MSIAMFAGFKRMMSPRMRVNSQRPKDHGCTPEVVEKLYAFNWLDEVLYEHATTRLHITFAAEHPEFARQARAFPGAT